MPQNIAIIVATWVSLAGPAANAEPILDVPGETQEAVAAVDRFLEALSTGDLQRAGAELDPEVMRIGASNHPRKHWRFA